MPGAFQKRPQQARENEPLSYSAKNREKDAVLRFLEPQCRNRTEHICVETDPFEGLRLTELPVRSYCARVSQRERERAPLRLKTTPNLHWAKRTLKTARCQERMSPKSFSPSVTTLGHKILMPCLAGLCTPVELCYGLPGG